MIWWALLPKRAKAAISGALGAVLLVGLVWGHLERRDAETAAQERLRIETEAMRDRIRHIEQERGRTSEIQTLGDDDLLDRLRGWVRNN